MRVLTLSFLLAACGGGAPSSTTTPARPAGTDGGEDWRGNLQQLVGTWTMQAGQMQHGLTCKWIADSTFLSCKAEGTKDAWLIGWEPTNRRYVWWTIEPNGNVKILSGSAGATDWVLENQDEKIGLHREAATRWTVKRHTIASGDILDGTLTTTSAPPPVPRAGPARASSEDWRSALEPFTGSWTFDGTVAGSAVSFRERCSWITASTYVLCTVDGQDELAMFGWEPHAARFVHYAISPSGDATVHVGTLAGKTWTFASEEGRMTLVRETGIRMAITVERKVPGAGWTPAITGTLTTQIE
jgi:hypothetical protein